MRVILAMLVLLTDLCSAFKSIYTYLCANIELDSQYCQNDKNIPINSSKKEIINSVRVV
jgi:hypothetical protein